MLAQERLNTLIEGMEVYDSDGARIGTVKNFRYGEGATKSIGTDIVTMAEVVSDALGISKELPTALYGRLYQEGFIRVATSLFQRDVIVFPHQIDDMGDGTIYLNVEKSELLKL